MTGDCSDENTPLKNSVICKKKKTKTAKATLKAVPKKEEATKTAGKKKPATIPRERKRKPEPAKTKGAPKAKKAKTEQPDEDEIHQDARKFFKAGQKFITPPNGDGTRGFYESLFNENKNSLIALRYVIEGGVLTGSLFHETLPRYFALKDKGAFKAAGGALQKDFIYGLDLEDIIEAEKKYAPQIAKRIGMCDLKKS